MEFLYPAFLAAAAAIAIPVIIHLFHFRRFKKVYFTNVKFLKEVKEETSSRSKLRNLLVLLMRALAILALVLAFAQPFLPRTDSVEMGQKEVSVYVDNSFSMQAQSADVPLLDKAKQRAREIVEAYNVDDRFQILTNDFEGRHQRLVSQEDALALIDEIKPSATVRTFSNVVNRQKRALETGPSPQELAYLISDFQKTTTDLQNYQDTTLSVNLVPMQAVREANLSIDSAWFEAPVQLLNQTSRLLVKVHNRTNEAAENVRLSINHNGQKKPVGTLNIPAATSVIDTANLTILQSGSQEITLSISDYPIQFDDTYRLATTVAEEIKVLIIFDDAVSPNLNAALNGVQLFKTTKSNIRNLDYSSFPSYDLIILDEVDNLSTGVRSELTKTIDGGGNVLLFPSAKINRTDYNGLMTRLGAGEYGAFETIQRATGRLNTEEFVFREVYLNEKANLSLPSTAANYKISNGTRPSGRLLTYRDGSTLLGKTAYGEGHLYWSAAPLSLEYSDLSRQGEIFVPMLFRMAISTARRQPVAYTIGDNEIIEVKNPTQGLESVVKLFNPNGEFIPEQRASGSKLLLDVNSEIPTEGHYQLGYTAEEPITLLAFNYDRRESDLSYNTIAELRKDAGTKISIIDSTAEANFTNLIEERNTGVTLWKWCLIAALLFLLMETLLIRFWKV